MFPPRRKPLRIRGYDYSTPGAYFITICTKNRIPLLAHIDVGTVVLDGPQIRLSRYGEIANKHLCNMRDFYDYITIDKYVIMPNHIHLLICIKENGPSRTTVPTRLSSVSRFIGPFKRFCNREYGRNIWQSRSYDHIIRNQEDYDAVWEYIENNPSKWFEDHLYMASP